MSAVGMPPSPRWYSPLIDKKLSCCVGRSTGNEVRGSSLFLTDITYSWIAYELQVGISLGRRHNLVRFQI